MAKETANNETVNTTSNLVDSVDSLRAKLAVMREAQKKFASYTQEQVDKIFFEAAMAANMARIPLAKQAVAETGMGIVEDKIIKNHYAAEYIYNAYKNTKTCGVIEEDPAYGIKKVAEPLGLIAAVIPTTNPTSTAIFKTLIALKTRNAIIISPHPRAKACTIAAAKTVLDAAVKAGAPEEIIGWIDVPSIELTNEVMREADCILATGGPGMVKAAYSSGKPALGVGAGNTPVIIDDTADIKLAVNSIIHSKTFDNGMICASEQSVTVVGDIYDEVPYAKSGDSGADGGKGGSGADGESVGGVSGGKQEPSGSATRNDSDTQRRSNISMDIDATANFSLGAAGGGGAGGNSGNNLGTPGGDAEVGSVRLSITTGYINAFVYPNKGGTGGDGADGADASVYGCSGSGAGGGGGAGGDSSASSNVSAQYYVYNITIETRTDFAINNNAGGAAVRKGGAGGKGGAGADGCIILYYGVTTPIQDGQLKDKNGLMLLDKYGRRLIV